jgi:ABC-type transporter Mla subunit MlaD
MLLIQESTSVHPALTSSTDSLCSATKELIKELNNDLLTTISKIENKKLSLRDALYYYRENSEIVATTFFRNEGVVSPKLQKLKSNLQAINQLISKSQQGKMFFTKESLNDTNWERNQFEGLPFFVVVERLQLINLEMNLLIERN